MSAIQISGTADAVEIAVVLTLLGRDGGQMPRTEGLSAWRERRRTALAGAAYRRTRTVVREMDKTNDGVVGTVAEMPMVAWTRPM